MPGTKDVGSNIKEWKAAHPDSSQAQAVAVALSEARRAGNKKVGAKPKSSHTIRRHK